MSRLGHKFLDELPSSMKGWKSRYLFLLPPKPFNFSTTFLSALPAQPTLPRSYKFEEPYLRSLELVDGQKFPSSDLISEENLVAYGLSVWTEDSLDRVIDEYDSLVNRPDITSFLISLSLSQPLLKMLVFIFRFFFASDPEMDPTLAAGFAQKLAANKAAEAEKQASRKATAEKRALAK